MEFWHFQITEKMPIPKTVIQDFLNSQGTKDMLRGLSLKADLEKNSAHF